MSPAESSPTSGPAQPRIAITGLGLVTPFGVGREIFWQRLLEGERAIRFEPDAAPQRHSRAGSTGFCVGRVPLPTSPGSRLIQFARLAVREALEQAGLQHPSPSSEVGCVIGTSKLDLNWFDSVAREDSTASTVNDAAFLFPSSAASRLAAEFGFQGAAICPIAACATGLVSLIRGAELIRSKDCNVVIAGSADASIHPGLLASYRRLGVLAHEGEDPAAACRPFDRNRDGFAVGEGAGMLVLEDWDHARDRGARILAEWVDGRIAGDASGLTSVDDSGSGLARLISTLLCDRSGNISDSNPVDAVCVHGTGTLLNDLAESRALRTALGDRAPQVPCFGIKGAIGHLLGAAGAVEAAASVMALQQGWIPPSANHHEPDPDCGIGLTQRPVRPDHLESILKLSLGFGGQLAAGLLRRVESLGGPG